MKEVESLMIKYVGYKEPSNDDEVALEVLGLRTAIAAAEQRIAVLTQSVKLREIVAKSQPEVADEKTVAETPETEEVQQQS